METISSPKTSINCLWLSHFLIKIRIIISQQPNTLLYSITDVFTRVFWYLFWKSYSKNLAKKIYSKTYVVKFPLDKTARLQSRAYCRTKNFTTDYFSWCLLPLVPLMTNSFELLKKYSIFSCRTEYLKMLISPWINLIPTSEALALNLCFVSLHWILLGLLQSKKEKHTVLQKFVEESDA